MNADQLPKRRSRFWLRLALVLVAIYLLANLLLVLSDDASAATPITDPAKVVVGLDPAVYQATLNSNPSPAVASALLGITKEGSVSQTAVITDSTIYCRGYTYNKRYIYIIGTSIQVAWRKSAIDTWCWNSTRITSWGSASGDAGKWAAAPYCWYNESHGNVWWSLYWERKVWNAGTLKTCGGLSLQKSATARVYYRRGGSYNFG